MYRSIILCTFAIFFIAQSVYAAEEALIVTDQGKVGIGTSDPKVELEVNGEIRATSLTLDEPFAMLDLPSGVPLKGNIIGLNVSSQASNPQLITVSPGACIDSSNNISLSLSSSMTKRLDQAWMMGDGNGGLLEGVVSSSNIYNVYIIRSTNGDIDIGMLQKDLEISNHLPVEEGFTNYRKLGFVVTDIDSNIVEFIQFNNDIYFAEKYGLYSIGDGNVAAWTSVDISGLLPMGFVTHIEPICYGSRSGTLGGARSIVRFSFNNRDLYSLIRCGENLAEEELMIFAQVPMMPVVGNELYYKREQSSSYPESVYVFTRHIKILR